MLLTPAEMMTNARSLLNDQDSDVFTDAVLLPYYNMSLQKLDKEFQLNNIPVTNETSISLPVLAEVNKIAFTGTIPQLPRDLVDIRQLWESPSGQEVWTPVTKRHFLPHYLDNQQRINQFLIYAWMDQEIRLVAANADNDLKIDYVQSLFVPITISEINTPNSVINVDSFLQEWMAGLAAYYIGENETRANSLFELAASSLLTSTGISVKGMQAIPVRRRPFRQSYKQRTTW